jgi:hypothetical protein
LKVAEEILRRGLVVNYGFFNRVESNAQKMYRQVVNKYETLIESGLRATFLGGESGNDEILKDIMIKNIKRDDIYYTVQAIREAARNVGKPIDISVSFIYPHPFYNDKMLEKGFDDTLTLIKDTMPDSILPNPPGPFPGSKWFINEKFGFDYYDPEQPNSQNLPRPEKMRRVANEMLSFDYILYLPPTMWTVPKYTLNGMNTSDMFKLNAELRNEIAKLGIETDLGDEHFLIARAAGYEGKQGSKDFKRESMLAIILCNYDFIENIYNKVNQTSMRLAKESLDNLVHK